MKVHIRDLETDEIIKSIEAPKNERMQEKFLMGLMRNMDLDKFYVDTSEIDDDD